MGFEIEELILCIFDNPSDYTIYFGRELFNGALDDIHSVYLDSNSVRIEEIRGTEMRTIYDSLPEAIQWMENIKAQ